MPDPGQSTSGCWSPIIGSQPGHPEVLTNFSSKRQGHQTLPGALALRKGGTSQGSRLSSDSSSPEKAAPTLFTTVAATGATPSSSPVLGRCFSPYWLLGSNSNPTRSPKPLS